MADARSETPGFLGHVLRGLRGAVTLRLGPRQRPAPPKAAPGPSPTDGLDAAEQAALEQLGGGRRVRHPLAGPARGRPLTGQPPAGGGRLRLRAADRGRPPRPHRPSPSRLTTRPALMTRERGGWATTASPSVAAGTSARSAAQPGSRP